MYAVYHGPEGLRKIALRVHHLTTRLAEGLKLFGFEISNSHWFDTLTVETGAATAQIHAASQRRNINFRRTSETQLGITLDETTTLADLEKILECFNLDDSPTASLSEVGFADSLNLPTHLIRRGHVSQPSGIPQVSDRNRDPTVPAETCRQRPGP